MMMDSHVILSASALYRQAGNVTPQAHGTAKTDSYCVMCAAPLPAGTAANPVGNTTFDKSFNNKFDLRALTGRYVCGDCEALWSQEWMQKYSKTFATMDGVYKFASNEQQAAFFLHPPEPPFCAIFSTKQQQHMIWRTPVSLSRELYTVRLDGELLTIRQPVLLAGLHAYRFAESLMANTPLARTGKRINPPAALFSRELAIQTLSLRADVVELLAQTGDGWVVEAMNRLSAGEWWALNVIRHFDPENPPEYQRAIEGTD